MKIKLCSPISTALEAFVYIRKYLPCDHLNFECELCLESEISDLTAESLDYEIPADFEREIKDSVRSTRKDWRLAILEATQRGK